MRSHVSFAFGHLLGEIAIKTGVADVVDGFIQTAFPAPVPEEKPFLLHFIEELGKSALVYLSSRAGAADATAAHAIPVAQPFTPQPGAKEPNVSDRRFRVVQTPDGHFAVEENGVEYDISPGWLDLLESHRAWMKSHPEADVREFMRAEAHEAVMKDQVSTNA